MSLFSLSKRSVACGLLLLAGGAAITAPAAETAVKAPWRSALYPPDWKPGFADAQGRFLHDFSYAGYQRGEKPIPDRKGSLIDVTRAPYNADRTGRIDATAALQAALDAAAAKEGGAVVFMPAGTYRVAPTGENLFALQLSGDRVVLRGEGVDKTFLFNDATMMRTKAVILVKPKNPVWWTSNGAPSTPLTAPVLKPTSRLAVESTKLFKVGDLVSVRSDVSEQLIASQGMEGRWKAGPGYPYGPLFLRRITKVDTAANAVEVDIPVRGFLYADGSPRVAKLAGGRMLTESALEDFSIGMKQHPGTGLDDNDRKNSIVGETAYELFRATAVQFDVAEHCWIRRVNSYRPPSNADNIHVLSFGIRIGACRNITVEACAFRFPQYRGEGGNGYMFNLYGNDCLVKNCIGEGGRHNFSFGEMSANGNVVQNFYAKDGRLASDFHMHLSMANLVEGVTTDGDFLSAAVRGYSSHGASTQQSVFWNTHGKRYMIEIGEYGGHSTRNPQVLLQSEQRGQGYVIGTSGPAIDVKTDDFYEGGGRGESLVPQSLYEDQLARRLKTLK